MYFVGEKDEYSEVDLLDYDCLIEKVNKQRKRRLIVTIVLLTLVAVVALLGLLVKLNIIPTIFNLRPYDLFMVSLTLLLPFTISLVNFFPTLTELKNLKNGRTKVEIYLENQKNKKESQENITNDEVEVVEDNINTNQKINEQVNQTYGLYVLENPNKEPSGNSGINIVFNIFWFIFVGLEGIIVNFFTGISYCLTTIGIPAGITCFKFIPLIFRPAGREVILNYGSHPVLNTLSLLFGGLISYLLSLIYGCILCITIIGIPLGRQMFKIGKFFLAPFGSNVILKDQYTDNRDLDYDLEIFIDQLCLEDRNVNLNDGRVVPASEAMKLVLTKADRDDIISKLEKYETIEMNANNPTKLTIAFSGIKINQSCVEKIVLDLVAIIVGTILCIPMFYLIELIFNIFWNGETGVILNYFLHLPLIDKIFVGFAYALFIISTIIVDIIKFNRFNKVKKIIKPAYLQKWKNITTYYPTKFKTSGRKLRKQAKNPTNRKEYVIAQSLPSMIHKILK